MKNGMRKKLNVIVFASFLALLVTAALQTTAASEDYALQIGGEHFWLEVAADNATRSLGLSGRESIATDGGMIFAFPKARTRSFFMRDCVIPIDIVFLDSAGVITATYTMVPEEPRGDSESKAAYEQRLARYSSQSRSQYAIELRAGTIKRLGLQQGGRVNLDIHRLQNALR
jgi:hypothetical protein